MKGLSAKAWPLAAPHLHLYGAGHGPAYAALDRSGRALDLEHQFWSLVLAQAALVFGALWSGDFRTQLFITAVVFLNDVLGLVLDLRAVPRPGRP